MSTLRVNTIENTAGASTPVDINIEGKVSAWVQFKGTGTVTINASSNVSSITDRGGGQYTVNFSSAFSNANYVYAGTGDDGYSTGTSVPNIVPQGTNADTSTSAVIMTKSSGSGASDHARVLIMFIGD
jgi:hypothetical protein